MREEPQNPIIPQTRSQNSHAEKMTDFAARAGEDSALLRGIQSGDHGAMAALFDRYSRIVYSVAMRVLGDPGHAEDVTQDIFIRIWRNPESFVSGRGTLGAWLTVVARNRSIDLLRRRRPTDSVEDVVLASPLSLAEESERNLLIERVRLILAEMPAEQRRSIELAFFEGLSHTEIAEKTGDPLGTVKTRIRLALIALRRAIKGNALPGSLIQGKESEA
jgi:RNA polymerase sigma-70 factor (ECF subfamily)